MGAMQQMLAAVGVTPATISFTDWVADTTDNSTYTFSSRSIGTAAANRYIIVTVQFSDVFTTASSVTVGGISATFVKRKSGAGATPTDTVEIWVASVPTGTTANVVVNTTLGVNNCSIGLWAAYGINPTAYATGESVASPPSTTLNIPAGGIAVGIAASNDGGNTWTWTGLTEGYDGTSEGPRTVTGAGSAFGAAQSGLTITATPSGTATKPVMALASFSPG